MQTAATVHIVEGDSNSRHSVKQLLQESGLNSVAHESAEQFLQHFAFDDMTPQCLLLEIRLPGLSGLGLQKQLVDDSVAIPTVFLTDVADVRMTVQAMKSGAVDVLEKPVQHKALLDCLTQALDSSAQQVLKIRQANALQGLVDSLSRREKEVMTLLLDARNTKEIAAILSISQQTVAKHRTAVLDKLEVDSVPALLRLDHGNSRLRRYCPR